MLDKIERGLSKFINVVGIVSAVIMVLLMVYVAADAVMRNLNHSFVGSNELVVNVVVLVVFLALGRTSVQDSQIKIDVFTFLPKLDYFTLSLTFIMYVVAGVAAFNQGILAMEMELQSSFLHIPRWPFLFVAGFGLILCGVGAVCVMMRTISKNRSAKLKGTLDKEIDEEIDKKEVTA